MHTTLVLFERAYAAVLAWRSDDTAAYNAAMLQLAAEVDRIAEGDPREIELEQDAA